MYLLTVSFDFTGGNPAAVCLLKEDLDDVMKQKIAAEMNLSETAFVVPIIADKHDHQSNISEPFEKSSKFHLRWFTPTTEVPLCGHATLASAAVLFYAKNNQNVSFFYHRGWPEDF